MHKRAKHTHNGKTKYEEEENSMLNIKGGTLDFKDRVNYQSFIGIVKSNFKGNKMFCPFLCFYGMDCYLLCTK